ncbi:MAG: molybdopterin molybdotransferase MoeA [Deferribacteraceae bacterium]|jgi:molybdopterin molybdotransferase|nr:molybdopterin molybdotransferase MoeA [Deferribacteraceae bacterium]
MIKPDEALKIVLDNISPVGAENIPTYSALGRVAAQKIISKRDIPLKNSSAMDGYAVYNDDIAVIPAKLKVLGVIAAGDDVSDKKMGKGECWRIMTGAHVPVQADTVVERELTDDSMPVLTVNKGKKKGDNIRPAKDDIAIGDAVECKGEIITPYMISRLISIGAFHIDVYRKPKVAVISTGSEIASVSEYDSSDKMIDANAPAIIGMLSESGAEPSYLGVVPDEESKLINILNSLKSYDLVAISGGISAGDFDCMAKISEKAGIKWHFHNVNQKPGKPVAFGTLQTGAISAPIFGLPGNPVSCMFCSYYYLIPAVRGMQGMKEPVHRQITAVLGEEINKKRGRIQFDRVKLEVTDGTLYAYPFRTQNSNVIASMVESHAFMELADDLEGALKPGTPVRVFIFNRAGLF